MLPCCIMHSGSDASSNAWLIREGRRQGLHLQAACRFFSVGTSCPYVAFKTPHLNDHWLTSAITYVGCMFKSPQKEQHSQSSVSMGRLAGRPVERTPALKSLEAICLACVSSENPACLTCACRLIWWHQANFGSVWCGLHSHVTIDLRWSQNL